MRAERRPAPSGGRPAALSAGHRRWDTPLGLPRPRSGRKLMSRAGTRGYLTPSHPSRPVSSGGALPSGVVDGILPLQNQLGDGHKLVAILKQGLDDAGQGLRRVLGGVVEEDDGARLLRSSSSRAAAAAVLSSPSGSRSMISCS